MSKKAITIIAGEESYNNLTTFDSLEELNKTVRLYKEQFHTKLTKSTLLVLDQLHRYSCVYLGVSFRTKNNIAKSLNISRMTVIRACKVLEGMGIIKQLKTKRKSDMRQSSNAIQILPHVENVTQDHPQQSVNSTEKCYTKKTTSRSLIQNNKELRKDEPSDSSVELPVSDWVDSSFAKYGSSFFPIDQVEELWKIAYIHSKILKLDSRTLVEQANHAIKQLVRKLKGRGRVKSVNGYFNGICKRRMKIVHIKQLWDLCWS
jgi:DNA-binding Lrp family transcriptional regulator